MANEPRNKPDALPGSADDLWEGAEQMRHDPVKVDFCNQNEHHFLQNGNAAECSKCPYGTLLPGYMRVLGGKIIDLRNGAGE